jgi:hypothetical protein
VADRNESAAIVLSPPLAFDVMPDGMDPNEWIPSVYEGKLDPNKFCRAWNPRSEKYCGAVSGRGTTHLGQGRCSDHSGLKDGDRRLGTGKYSMERGGIKHKTIADLYEQFLADPDPTNLLDEIALMRGLIVNFINEHEARTEALLAWHAERTVVLDMLPGPIIRGFETAFDLWQSGLKESGQWSPEREREAEHAEKVLGLLRNGPAATRPKKVSDISDAVKLLDDLGRMVDRVETMRSKNAISEAELNRIINMMGRSVDVLVSDEELKGKIREAWIAIVTR